MTAAWTAPEREALLALGLQPLDALLEAAGALRDSGKVSVITYSRKVFIPLTELCRDVCHYCTYAKTPRRLTPGLPVTGAGARHRARGQAAGCHEALFTLGDKPELRYRAAREALERLGYASTVDYLGAMARLVLDETGLLPHLNPGVLSADDYRAPAAGGAVHGHHAGVGLAAAQRARRAAFRFAGQGPGGAPGVDRGGRAKHGVPLTIGILIGIGETRDERLDSPARAARSAPAITAICRKSSFRTSCRSPAPRWPAYRHRRSTNCCGPSPWPASCSARR